VDELGGKRHFQGNIVPRNYGVFAGEIKCQWGGTIYCVVLEYFSGLPWTGIANGTRDTLENQYVGVPIASVDFLFVGGLLRMQRSRYTILALTAIRFVLGLSII
jgi:hypothetical protein